MSRRSITIQAVLGGVGVFLVDLWPVILVWRAGATGSVGDLSAVRLLWVGVLYALVVGILAAGLLRRALTDSADRTAGRLDPWGAYALGAGVYNLALMGAAGLLYQMLLGDENASLRANEWKLFLLWFGGRVVAGILAIGASRFVIGRRTGQPAPV